MPLEAGFLAEKGRLTAKNLESTLRALGKHAKTMNLACGGKEGLFGKPLTLHTKNDLKATQTRTRNPLVECDFDCYAATGQERTSLEPHAKLAIPNRVGIQAETNKCDWVWLATAQKSSTEK